MFTPEFILGTHQKLQDLLPEAHVLVGGSYFYGTAGEGSDLDLYVVVSTWKLFRVARRLREYQVSKPAGVTVMLLPTLCLRLGLYTIEGVDVGGGRVRVVADKPTGQATSLKLALYYYCLARELRSEEYLKKATRQVAHYFATGESKRAVGQGPFEQELQIITEEYRRTSRFNWRTYLWYNIFFLRKKDTLFLLRNPDTMLITQLYTCLIHPEKWSGEKKAIARTVFPVMMY